MQTKFSKEYTNQNVDLAISNKLWSINNAEQYSALYCLMNDWLTSRKSIFFTWKWTPGMGVNMNLDDIAWYSKKHHALTSKCDGKWNGNFFRKVLFYGEKYTYCGRNKNLQKLVSINNNIKKKKYLSSYL